MANVVKKKGKKYNIFDKINNVWNQCSLWTHADDVEFDDGKSATTKLSAINGITSDLSGEAEDIAASIKCVNQINSSLAGLSFGQDTNGNWGYIKAGADTVTPFLNIQKLKTVAVESTNHSGNMAIVPYPNGYNKQSSFPVIACQYRNDEGKYNIIGTTDSITLYDTDVAFVGAEYNSHAWQYKYMVYFVTL